MQYVAAPGQGGFEELSDTRKRLVRSVGKYRILSELGRGGMANVYLAVARGPEDVSKLVVLKALLPDLASEPGALAMFLDEARVAAQLNHANIVQTYEVGIEGDRHVIVMEYLEGQPFGSIVKRAASAGTPVSPALSLRVIINALEGLHYVHELSAYDGSPMMLVHRDISPQNIFVTYGGQVKVLDFGIAKAASSSIHTATGIVKGKIAYMAPEQMVAGNVDRRADIYSVGCMLWAVATGQKLWKDTPDVHIMRSVIKGEIPTPQSVNPGCDNELNRIVMKALAPERDDRYQTALELQEELEHYCESFTMTVKQKELAAFVSGLFADTRAELKALVERQLALIAKGGDGTSSGVRVPVEFDALSSAASRSGTSEAGQNFGTGTGTRAQQRSSLPWIAAVAVVLLLAGGFYFFNSARSVAEAPPVAPVVSNPAAAAETKSEPARPTTVTMQLRANPPQAKLFLDDQRLPSNPTSKVLPLDGAVHHLRAEAEGYRPVVEEFTAQRDDVIEINLVKVEPAAEAQKPAAPQRYVRPTVKPGPAKATPEPAPTPVQAATAKPKCAQPFFVGEDGIKRLRPECM